MSSPNFPSPRATELLQLELSLLQVLHHRNKNQHHLQPFFKHLSILKRTLSLLLDHPDSEFLLQKLRAYCLGGVELGEDIDVEYTGLREENEELGVPIRRHIMDEETMVGDSEDHDDENMAMELNPSPPEDLDVVSETEQIQTDATLEMKGPEEETLGEILEPPKKRRRKRRMDDIDILFAGLE